MHQSASPTTEQRFAEIYSYYLDERYADDLSCSFVEWLSTSMYGKELENMCAGVFSEAYQTVKRGGEIPLLKHMDTKTAATCTFDDLLKR